MTSSRARRRPARAGADPSPWSRGARAAAIAAAAAAPLAFWASSCALGGFNRVDDPPPTVPDAGGEEAGCPHATYPPPPDAAGAGGDVEFVVAVRSIDLGEGQPNAEVGLDLDLTCSCQGEGPTCTPLNDAGPRCDGPDGRDNAALRIFNVLSSAFGSDAFGSDFYSQQSETGGWSLLMRIRGYNGQPDDDRVRFDWYITTSFALGNPGQQPAWGGNDEWPVSSTSLYPIADAGMEAGTPLDGGTYDLEGVKYTDSNAYVSGGVLVAALPEAELVLAGSINTISVKVSGGFVVAPIEPVPGVGDGFALRDGTLVGRWRVEEVFRSISSFRDNDGMPYCTTGLFYSAGKKQFCASADILDSPGSPTSPCDALSLGIKFQTHPAKLGTILDPAPPTPGCDPASDPANDSCN